MSSEGTSPAETPPVSGSPGHSPVELPLLSYQEGRLLMDENARRLSIPSLRTIAQAARVVGPLDEGAFTHACRCVVERHEALRTRFSVAERKQVIEDSFSLEVPVTDARPDGAGQDTLAQVLRDEAMTPFEESGVPRFRARIVRLGAEDNVVAIVVDHLVVDAWARSIILDEISAVYGASVGGGPADLHDVTLRYSDYVRREAGVLGGEEGQRLMTHWRTVLGGASPIPRLELGSADVAPGGPPRGGKEVAPLPDALATRLRAFSARERVTTSMVLIAALQTALYRYTGVSDQMLAVNWYNRDSMGTERLVAPLADLVVFRTDFARMGTLRNVLEDVREQTFERYEYGKLPYGFLVKSVDPKRYADPGEPIGVVFNMQYGEMSDAGLDLPGLDAVSVPVFDELFRPRSRLVVAGNQGSDGLYLSGYYQADALRPAFVERLLRDVLQTIDEMVDDLDRAA